MTHEHPSRPTGYEKRDANIRLTGIYTVLVILMIVVFVVNLNELFVWTNEEIRHELVLSPISEDYLSLRADEERILNSYALIDTANGVYRIPIERALELTAAEANTGR